eukprot:Gb_10174 [translate_table: standard]
MLMSQYLFVSAKFLPLLVNSQITWHKVHITQGDYEGKAIIVSWVTSSEPGSNQVFYGTTENNYEHCAEGNVTTYTFYNYTSGFIHHCLIDGLEVWCFSSYSWMLLSFVYPVLRDAIKDSLTREMILLEWKGKASPLFPFLMLLEYGMEN